MVAINEIPPPEWEVEYQKMADALQEKEKLLAIAHKAAHDLTSPLSALNMMMHACNELPSNKRFLIKRATESILDIANHLLSTYRREERPASSDIESCESLLVSDLINQLVSEKKVQYQHREVIFETIIENNARFVTIRVQKMAFRRMMSNLINNAVDALEGKQGGVIRVQLTADAESVVVKVKDNGKGMARDKLEKMLARQSFTEGKKDGHGLGLQQVWDTLEYNQGKMAVQSNLNKGTLIQLTFPRIAFANEASIPRRLINHR